MITLETIEKNKSIRTYITKADTQLSELGYTEHSFAHVKKTALEAGKLLERLGYDPRTCEVARIAGYLHDIGNGINRVDHAQSGAVMAFTILTGMGMDAEEISDVIAAIGNHDEGTATPISPIAAALIIADKSDVRRSRVRNADYITFDIHDRVNYATIQSELQLDDVTRQLGSRKGNMGFLLPAMGKEQLFKTVMADGVLPRKTFSMGHAQDKRYYVESRRITK